MARLSFFIIAVALESIIFAPASAAGGGPLVDRSIEQKPAKHGSKPPEALAGQLIQCRFAKASRSWPGRRSDDGHQRAWTYPIGAKWTWKTFYRTATNVEANREDVFTCYVDAFEPWTCGLGERIKEGLIPPLAHGHRVSFYMDACCGRASYLYGAGQSLQK